MARLSLLFRQMTLAGIAALCVQQASAADFPRFPKESAPEFITNRVEMGSGWYLRGDMAMSNNKGPQLTPEAPDRKRIDWAVDFGGGYKFNNWLRADATITWNKQRDFTTTGVRVTCPYSLTGLSNQVTQILDGYLWDTAHETCDPKSRSESQKMDFLLNAYVDLGTWHGFTPFIGVGAGVARLKTFTSSKFLKTSDSSEYAADLTPTGNYPHIWVDAYGQEILSWTDGSGAVHQGNPPVSFGKQVWSRTGSKASYNLSWALMTGVAYDVTPQLKAELGYRYLNSGTSTSISSPLVGAVKSKIDSHQLRLGLRYMID